MWRTRPPRLRIVCAVVLIAVAASPSLRHRDASASDRDEQIARGAALFESTFTPAQGLGPLFNHTSCAGCHVAPAPAGMGPEGLGIAIRVGRLTAAGFDPMIGRGGPVARARSVAELSLSCDLVPGIPASANVTSVRNAPALHGVGLIDAISDADIESGAVAKGDGVHGRAHLVPGADGLERVGRFGWKADIASLRQFVAEAFRNELGITSPLAPVDLSHGQSRPGRCPGESATLEDDGTIVNAVTAFLAALSAPVRRSVSADGAALFEKIGCGRCHTPSLPLADGRVWLYSDLLLHDLGPDLDDKIVQGTAGGREWRTTPLWGLGARLRLLHDGRARTIAEAILAHGGEAAAARERFRRLSTTDRGALIAFLNGL